jgi:FKBP-type peptidyl-prolyl cis-trans isomerase FkpA
MLKKIFGWAVVAAMFGGMLMGCKSSSNKLENETDSLSYVIGLNVGQALMRMDSTLNVEAVCMAIKDVYAARPLMTMSDARDYYLGQKVYFVHEKAMAYQEQFLADLAKRDRSFVRTRSGVTYKIEKLGDQNISSLSSRDTVRIAYTIRDDAGKLICEMDTLRCSYRDLLIGLRDVVRIAGSGGEFEAWLPSKEAYGSAGEEELGIAPHQLLNYRVSVIDIEYRHRR